MAAPESNLPNYEIVSMSDNMLLRLDPDGSLWGKVSQPQPFKQNQSKTGTVYINGRKYTTSSQVFVKLLPG